MAIKDEGTFHLKQAARDMLKRLGSKRSQQIGWRDMWAFVTIKGHSPSSSAKGKGAYASGMLGRVPNIHFNLLMILISLDFRMIDVKASVNCIQSVSQLITHQISSFYLEVDLNENHF